jgi:hypothetical protein
LSFKRYKSGVKDAVNVAVKPSKPKPVKLSGNVTLSTYSPAFIAFVRARIDSGATNDEIQQEFSIAKATVQAIRKTTLFSKGHVAAIKSGLASGFAAVAATALSTINKEKLDACSAPQLAMVAGVAVDKLRLLQGESTQNVSFKDAGANAVDHLSVVEGVLSSLVGSIDTGEQAALPSPSDAQT